MTYFETPDDRDAFLLGVSLDDYTLRQDRVTEDEENLDALGRPDLDPEDRDLIAESDVETVSAQDRADLATVLDVEEFHI